MASNPTNDNREGIRGRVAIVTGAASGIGRSIALALAREGARVVVLDRNLRGAERTVAEIQREGGEAVPQFCDVTRSTMIDTAVAATLARWGRLDILVNDAGVAGPMLRVDAIPEHQWDQVLDVNLKGTFLFTQRVLPTMAARGFGRIITIASAHGLVGAPLSAAYVASKHAVIGFTKTVALEWGTRGITANTVCPGYVDTPMGVQPDRIPDHLERVLARSAIKRIAEPSEIASLVLFLASPQAGYITGASLAIDGGITAG